MSRTKHHVRGPGKLDRRVEKQLRREFHGGRKKPLIAPVIDEDAPARGVGEGLSAAGRGYMDRTFGSAWNDALTNGVYVTETPEPVTQDDLDDIAWAEHMDALMEQERAEREAAEAEAYAEWVEHLDEVFPTRDPKTPYTCEEFRAHAGGEFLVRLPYIPRPLFHWTTPQVERVRVATLAREVGIPASDMAEFLRTRMNEYVRDGRSTVVAPVADKVLSFFDMEAIA